MGHHFDPQFYLGGFAKPGTNSLFMYEKGRAAPRLLPIKEIGQEKDLYSHEIENRLSVDIEGPANRVLGMIRGYNSITDEDKKILSDYIYVFYKRVPKAKKRFQAASLEIAIDLKEKISGRLDSIEREDPEKSDTCRERKEEAEQILKEFATNPDPKIWQDAILIENDNAPEIIQQMTWTFFTCIWPEVFITSDNPVFVHPRLGINKLNSELSLPINRGIALLATWWDIKDLQYLEANQEVIRQMNRRTAYNRDRFLYSDVERPWISNLNNKDRHIIQLFSYPGPRRSIIAPQP